MVDRFHDLSVSVGKYYNNNTCTRFDVVTRPAFLPPPNEVWGRVMFSQVFIRPPGGGLFFFPACITGHMTRVASASRQMACMGGVGRPPSPGVPTGRGVGRPSSPALPTDGGEGWGVGQNPQDTRDTTGYGVNQREVRILLEYISCLIISSRQLFCCLFSGRD